MPLKNKYLKYSPEITLEIFILVWDKLIKCGLRESAGKQIMFNNFKNFGAIYTINNCLISTHSEDYKTFKNLNKTTVQEILGYDPFVKDKQSLKQAVHCKTQEEWDFVKDKIVDKSTAMFKKEFQKDSAITYINSWDSLDYLTKNDYQILSFQEWCDLNGYKMENEVKFEVGNMQKSNQKFKEKDWVIVTEEILESTWVKRKETVGYIFQISNRNNRIESFNNNHAEATICLINKFGINYEKKWIRHATPEEINNHLISIGEIPAEPVCINTNSSRYDSCGEKYGCKQDCSNCDYYQIPTGESLGYSEAVKLGNEIHEEFFNPTIESKRRDNWTVKVHLKPNLILFIDDEELPMVNIIKTKTVNLLNND